MLLPIRLLPRTIGRLIAIALVSLLGNLITAMFLLPSAMIVLVHVGLQINQARVESKDMVIHMAVIVDLLRSS